MSLLFPLLIGLFTTRTGASLALRNGITRVRPWASWPGAAGVAMTAALIPASVTHFKQPQRSGLVAIVPGWVPMPSQVVTATGLLELLLATSLVFPRTRQRGAIGTIVLLIAIFPANVVAAHGVDHASAPDTPLLRRTLLQLVFITTCLLATTNSGPSTTPDKYRAR
jgi:uncharacterized membrane protein